MLHLPLQSLLGEPPGPYRPAGQPVHPASVELFTNWPAGHSAQVMLVPELAVWTALVAQNEAR